MDHLPAIPPADGCPGCGSGNARANVLHHPRLADLERDYAAAVAGWVANGFPAVEREDFTARRAECIVCPFWQRDGGFGFGVCAKCNCKLLNCWKADARCPEKRWPSRSIA